MPNHLHKKTGVTRGKKRGAVRIILQRVGQHMSGNVL